jgi:hypothetical protein
MGLALRAAAARRSDPLSCGSVEPELVEFDP